MGDEAEDKIQHGMVLGAWVRERRRELGLTAEEVALRMGPGVPANYVTQLENGGRKRMIGQPRVGQLAHALEVSEVDLLRGAGLITGARSEGVAIPPPDVRRNRVLSLVKQIEWIDARFPGIEAMLRVWADEDKAMRSRKAGV